jgi:hypothetical protein
MSQLTEAQYLILSNLSLVEQEQFIMTLRNLNYNNEHSTEHSTEHNNEHNTQFTNEYLEISSLLMKKKIITFDEILPEIEKIVSFAATYPNKTFYIVRNRTNILLYVEDELSHFLSTNDYPWQTPVHKQIIFGLNSVLNNETILKINDLLAKSQLNLPPNLIFTTSEILLSLKYLFSKFEFKFKE